MGKRDYGAYTRELRRENSRVYGGRRGYGGSCNAVYNRSYKRPPVIERRQLRTLLLLAAIFLLAVSSFFGADLMSARASGERSWGFQKYYTSIEIQDGDSLWSIAEQYKMNSGKTTGELVAELKRMNRLEEDTIHSGHYLTVPYYVKGDAVVQ